MPFEGGAGSDGFGEDVASNPASGSPDPIAPLYGDGGAVGAAADIGAADQQISPLVLDLTGAGINLTALSAASPYFDIAGNGFARKVGWIGAGTGLLAIDRNGDGQINDISELFGQHGSVLDGFAALRALDSNGDGVIDAQDAAFSQLRVWVNPEGDGVVHPGELLTLAQLGITSISLAAAAASQVIAGNTVKLTSSYTLADGTTRTIADAWFSNSATYTRQVAGVTLSADVMALPELAGHGTMAGLRAAMTSDPTLKSLVAAFAADPGQATPADVQAIMLQWSGSAAIDPGSRGGNFDARKLDFLEKYTGIPFTSQDGDPRWRASISLQEGWNAAVDGVTARLVLQAGNTLPEFTYDAKDDIVLPATTLQIALYSLEVRLGDVTASSIGQWEVALRVADAFRLDAHIDTGYYLAAIEQNAPDSVAALASAIAYGMSYSVDQGGNVSLTGVTEHAVLYAGVGSTNIQINGGDTGLAPPLDDTVVFNAFDGHLELGVTDHSNTRSDTLLFGAGIEASDVTVRLNASGNLILSVGSTGDQVQVDAMFTGAVAFHGSVWDVGTYYDSGVTRIQFADGTMWTRDQIHAMALTATTGADVVYGTDQAETFDGQGAPAGLQDYMQGGSGADTFVFKAGYGHLEINYNTGGVWSDSGSALQFGAGITAADVGVSRDQAGNLFLTDGVAGDRVELDGMMYLNPWGAYANGVGSVRFADGTVWSRQQIAAMTTTGTAGADILYGDGGTNTFDGLGAPVGSQDYEQGSGGADTFVFKAGYGHLEVNFNTGGMWSDSGSTLQLEAGITAADVGVSKDQAGNLFLTDGVAGDRVELDGMMNPNPWGAHAYGVGSVQFADGTVWTAQQIAAMTTMGTAGADILYADGGTNTFDGLGAPAGSQDYEQGSGGVDTFVFKAGYGHLEVNFTTGGMWYDSGSALQLGAGITASDVSVRADQAGNLFLTDGVAGDRVELDRMMNLNPWGAHDSGVGSVRFADGTVWTAQQVRDQLPGSSKAFTALTLDKGQGQVTAAIPGTGTISLGAGIAASDVYLQTDEAGSLIVRLRDAPGDSLTVSGALYSDSTGLHSQVGQLLFADGTSRDLAHGVTLDWIASSTTPSLAGSNSGANVFELAPGGVIATGSSQTANTYVFHQGDGQAQVVPGGGSNTVVLAPGITSADVMLQTDDAGDLTVRLLASGDALTIKGDLSRQGGQTVSMVGQIALADGTGLAAGQSYWSQGQALAFTWAGSGSGSALVGSGWGANTFVLGAGGDQVTFGNGSLGGSNQNTVLWGRGDGQALVNLNGGTGSIQLRAGISAADVVLQADDAGDLTVSLAGDAADSVTLKGDLYSHWGTRSQVGQIAFADGTAMALGPNLALTWIGTASNTVLTGSGWGSNTFELGAGGDQVTFGNGRQDGGDPNQNTVLFGRGDGQATVNVNGAPGTLRFAAGISASDVILQANDAGDLTVALRDDAADSVTLQGDLYSHWGTRSQVGQIAFADGTAMTLGPNLALTWVGTAASTVLTGSGWGSNTFELGAGGDQVTFGNGRQDGGDPNQNTVLFGRGDGQATVNVNGAPGTVQLGAGISAGDLTYQADDAGDLTISLDGDAADGLILKGDLYNSWGTAHSRVGQLTFADGTSTALGPNLALTWVGTASNTVLTGSGWGSNTFQLGAGGDQVTFGTGSQGGSNQNTVVFGRGDGQAVVNINGAAGTIKLGADISAGDVILQADNAGNLTLALRDDAADGMILKGDLYSSWGTAYGRVSQLTFGDGTSLGLGQGIASTWIGTASSTVLTGSNFSSNTFELGAGGDQVTFGNGSQGGSNQNTVLFGRGDGQAGINLNGGVGTIRLGAGISASDLTFQADDATGDLTVSLRGDPADAITIKGDLYNSWGTVYGRLGQLAFADGTSLGIGGSPTSTWTGTAANTVLAGSGWGANTFELGAGGDQVTFGNGSRGGSSSNTVLFGKGDGAATVSLNGGSGVIQLGEGIALSDVLFSTDANKNLTLMLKDTGDSLAINGGLASSGAKIQGATFADGTTLSQQQIAALATIFGTTGADVLTGGSGPDTFDGKGAPSGSQDTEQGQGGADVFIFDKGYGQLQVNEDVGFWGGDTAAVLKIGAGVTAADMSATRNGWGDVFLTDGIAGDRIEIEGLMNNAGRWGTEFGVAQVQFLDGTAWSRNQVAALASMGTTGSDVINGTAGNDILDGRGGGDVITGGGGSDTYLFRQGYGALAIDNSTAGGTTVQGEIDFGPGITGQNLWLSQAGSDLMISVLNSADTVDLKGWFGANPSAQLAEVKGYDGLRLDSQVGQLVTAMAAYAGSNAGFDPATASALPADPALRSALAAAWHS